MAYPVSRIPTTDQDMTAILDFDSEEEFNIFFLRTRMELLETFRKATDVRFSFIACNFANSSSRLRLMSRLLILINGFELFFNNQAMKALSSQCPLRCICNGKPCLM